MQNRWNAADAPPTEDALASCVYGSRLLGQDADLVLHGGGNTSVKTTVTDITGETVDVIHVKGSGWDLGRIEAPGFAPLRLERLRKLLELPRLSDPEMMKELRGASLDPAAPDPSVEALLHAHLRHVAVLHSHADALIALTNQPNGAKLVREALGPNVIIVPYVMPGFDLARAFADISARELAPDTIGIVLLNHGLVTFGSDVEEAYRRHIDLTTQAERYLGITPDRSTPDLSTPDPSTPDPKSKDAIDTLRLAELRRDVSAATGSPMILTRHDGARIRDFVGRPDLDDVSQRGPATPDHVIRTKRVPLVGLDVAGYASRYGQYFDDHQGRARTPLTMLDPAPRVILDPAFGMITAGRRAKDAAIAADIYRHTIDIIDTAERVGRYQALPAGDIFDVEYWDLEQAKLRRAGAHPDFAGEVALVTGAASGIGRACVAALLARGTAVVGIDVNERTAQAFDGFDYLGLTVDVTNNDAVEAAIRVAVERFGGVDIVVAAAGIFPDSRPIADLDLSTWRRTMSINVDSIAFLLSRTHPYLARSPRGGRVVLVASKNVPAPGPGAAAYSASKAAVVQLGRVAALEWAKDQIRVNMIHPDAVFDTGLWTTELLEDRAAKHGLTVEQYKRRNLLGAEITSAQVGELTAALCSDTFAATTGAQIPIDGGNERVI
jgi:rhamnose utilization protein RhaD (predicted bifunctional aldolase and dehydrogenase)/NAD(P)-dependent dehydrogenase (short-subunit alcohol dehydrogenase family)